MKLTQSELNELNTYLKDYASTPEAQSMKHYYQHGNVSTFEHVMHVTQTSYYLNKRFHLGADMKSLVIGSFLHDFYLYDWHEKDDSHRWHGFHHPTRALSNANRLFSLNQTEQDIIKNHMWPLTIQSLPKSKESLLVCFVDKYCSTIETLFRRS